MRSRAATCIALLSFIGVAFRASEASAGLHLTSIVQVFGGTPASPSAQLGK